MTPQEYVDAHGNACPFCHAKMVEGFSVDISDGRAYQECSCMTCNREWVDVYTLTHFEPVETDAGGTS